MKSHHKLLGWVIGIPLLVLLLIIFILFHEPEKNGIDRAVAAKSLALVLVSPDELEAWQQEYASSHFAADELEEWYVPYLDYLYEGGYLDPEKTPADSEHAEGVLTYGEAARMMRTLAPELESLVKATKQNREKPYPAESWWLLYDSVLHTADPDGNVQVAKLQIYGTPDNIPDTPAWTAYTNLGTVKFAGLTLDHLLDHELNAYVRDHELIHVTADLGESTLYRNVWIISGDEKSVKVFLGDIERELKFQKKSKKTVDMTGHLADLQMERGEITKVSLKTDTITARVLSVQEDAIELEGYGLVPLDEEAKVLKTYGELKRQSLSNILVGYDMEEFVVAKGKICAALTVREFQADRIRVLIMNNQFQGAFHESIAIQSDGNVTVEQGDDGKRESESGTELTYVHGDDSLSGGRIILEPGDGQKLKVTSLERAQGAPEYAGRLEILDTEEGLVLINDLYLEDYLKAVVPSEMPAEYAMEALKAQAVCARTYAYKQIQSNTYSQYGAQVDDSTNFQVYNNIATDSRTDDAVQQTYGKLMLYDGSPVSAYYFSTSCGTTTDPSIWGSDPEDTPYLESVALRPSRNHLTLTDNDDFKAFIKRKDYPSYDGDFPFYRWNVTTSTRVLSNNISGVGEVKSIEITQRGAGGVARKLHVTGTEGEKVITGQNAIRASLGDASLSINRQDGKKSEGWSSLPSGFIAIDDLSTGEDGIHRFQIYGGGYGHGVGMSQNGAQGMAKDGMGYEEILKFFYDGVEVREME